MGKSFPFFIYVEMQQLTTYSDLNKASEKYLIEMK